MVGDSFYSAKDYTAISISCHYHYTYGQPWWCSSGDALVLGLIIHNNNSNEDDITTRQVKAREDVVSSAATQQLIRQRAPGAATIYKQKEHGPLKMYRVVVHSFKLMEALIKTKAFAEM